MTYLKWIFSNVKINSETIAKMCLNEYTFELLVDVKNHSLKTGSANVSEKATLAINLEMFFYIGKYPS